ncbi:uncharacterized protein METZ01_LOCUS506990, partial [marine metagenome]
VLIPNVYQLDKPAKIFSITARYDIILPGVAAHTSEVLPKMRLALFPDSSAVEQAAVNR